MLFKKQSLGRKLVIFSLLTTVLSLVFSNVAFIALEHYLTQQDSRQQNHGLAVMLARQAAHELAFGHIEGFSETLKTLRAEPNIASVCLFDTNDNLLASFHRGVSSTCQPPQTISSDLTTLSVVNGSEVLGTLVVNADGQRTNQRMRQLIGFAALITAAAIALAILAASRLKDIVLTPIRDLSWTLSHISQENDFSIRARKETSDELGALVDLFNVLLNTVETEHQALKDNESRFRTLAKFSPVGIFQINSDNELQYVNERWRTIHQLENDSPTIKDWMDSIASDDLAKVHAAWLTMLDQQTNISMDIRLQTGTGQTRWVHLVASPIQDDQGMLAGYLGAVSDISELKAAQLQMENLAFYDSLTGLANRRLFKNRLSKSIKTAERDGSTLALMFLDMDQFKRINDTLGHDAGDLLLQEMARRLSANVGDRDTVSRIGGDEFTILLADIHGVAEVARVANRLLTAMSQPIRLKGQDISTSVSIGITLAPSDSTNTNVLMKNADLAMYRAKALGRNNYQFFAEEMNHEIIERLNWEQELREALEKNQFHLVFQPKVNLQDLTISGVEALIRWNHPTKGSVSPDVFINIAEETGQIIDIGHWALVHSCMQFATLLKAGQLPATARLAVNLSARQFSTPNLVDGILQALTQADLPPTNLELEITESTLMEDIEAAIATMSEMRSTGVRFAIDDFGTGYSSLAYLKRLPIEVLKVDRSFVNDIPDDSNDMAITAAVIAMAHKLGLQVVAEGVESMAQMHFLQANQCDEAQGYLFSPPLSLTSLETLLNEHKAEIITA